MIHKMWKQERSREALTLKYHTPEHFTRCHWQNTEKVKTEWLVYRGIVALVFTISVIYTEPVGPDVPLEKLYKYPIFLTHWTYILELLMFELAFIIVAIKWYSERKGSTEPVECMPWYYKLYWVLYTIVLPSAIAVSVIFWGAIYDPELYPANLPNLLQHGFNSVIMILDFFLVAHSIRILHFYIPATYAFVYAIFSAIYQTSGGTGLFGMIPIYKILDWREPWKAVLTCFISLLLLLILYFMFILLQVFKQWIKRKRTSEQQIP